MEEEKEIKDVVHLFGADINGNLPLDKALTKIKGIGINLSKVLTRVLSRELNVSESIKIGQLNDEQLKFIENTVKNMREKAPQFLLNKRKSPNNKHLISSELAFDTKQVIEFEKNLYTWRGFRHAYGQKVRGQCTRTSGRKGLTVGVMRSKVAKAAGEKKEEAKK
jgi:small subunit ribosomal protein S13